MAVIKWTTTTHELRKEVKGNEKKPLIYKSKRNREKTNEVNTKPRKRKNKKVVKKTMGGVEEKENFPSTFHTTNSNKSLKRFSSEAGHERTSSCPIPFPHLSSTFLVLLTFILPLLPPLLIFLSLSRFSASSP